MKSFEVWIGDDGWHLVRLAPAPYVFLNTEVQYVILKLILDLHSRNVEDVLADPVHGLIDIVPTDHHAFGDVDVESSLPQISDARLIFASA